MHTHGKCNNNVH